MNPQLTTTLIFLMKNIITSKYSIVIFMKIRSLKKKTLVTLILLSWPAALMANAITTVVMKKLLPTNADTDSIMSPFSAESPPAAIAEKTSGAPLPNARRVTPARDSERDSFSEIASRAGDR